MNQRLPRGIAGLIAGQQQVQQQDAMQMQQAQAAMGLVEARRKASAPAQDTRPEILRLQDALKQYPEGHPLREQINARIAALGPKAAEPRTYPIVETTSGIFERRPEGLVQLKGPDGKPLTKAAPAAAPLPKPKVGFRWNADGTEQERIPGGPVDMKFKADKAQAGKSVGAAMQNMGELDRAMEDLSKHPGLPRITGSLMGRTYNVTPDATAAQAQLDSLKAQTFVSALQAMRDASKTGGAVGQVTEREGDKLENSLAALGQAQGTADFRNQLKIAQNRLKTSMALIRNAYKEQYGEEWAGPVTPPPAPPTPPQPAAGAFSDPDKERRYQEWKAKQGK